MAAFSFCLRNLRDAALVLYFKTVDFLVYLKGTTKGKSKRQGMVELLKGATKFKC